MTTYPKVIRDDKVAVIYSPGYGAGWYSWNLDHPGLLFDPEVVRWIEFGKKESEVADLEFYLDAIYPNGYFSMDKLVIEWLPVGTEFIINEYDGSESISIREEFKSFWIVA